MENLGSDFLQNEMRIKSWYFNLNYKMGFEEAGFKVFKYG